MRYFRMVPTHRIKGTDKNGSDGLEIEDQSKVPICGWEMRSVGWFFNLPKCPKMKECVRMYARKCVQVSKDEGKCCKIFRPWDVSMCKDGQDSTISTTTEVCEVKTEPQTTSYDDDSEQGFRTKKDELTPTAFHSPQHLPTLPQDTYHDYFPVHLAQSLGLHSNDPLFLESLTNGYAIEEYARVLSQEHQTKLLNARKQRPKKYKCPHCDVGFSNNGQLKGHIRIHTGERPYKCDDKNCGKTFTRNEELTRHKRIHSGLRPFPCPQCGKRFGRKDHLKKHSRTHMQPRGLYAVPVMLPLDTWTAAAVNYPYVPMFSY